MTHTNASRPFTLVVAADEARGIGKDGGLPWRLPGDMAFFKRVTSSAAAGLQNAVVMGRKTYESIPSKFRPLAHRLNVVLTRTPEWGAPSVLNACSLDDALAQLDARDDLDQVFVIGGGQVYDEALRHPRAGRVLLTRVHATFDCDTQLAPFEHGFRLISQDGPHDNDQHIRYTFETYERST